MEAEIGGPVSLIKTTRHTHQGFPIWYVIYEPYGKIKPMIYTDNPGSEWEMNRDWGIRLLVEKFRRMHNDIHNPDYDPSSNIDNHVNDVERMHRLCVDYTNDLQYDFVSAVEGGLAQQNH